MKTWPEDYECTGQTSIFDFIQDNSEPEILLHPGEHVWKVILGDIFEYEVEDWTYRCGEGNRGYGLIYIDPEDPNSEFHTYSRAWNDTIGVNIFRTLEEAHIQAAKNLSTYEHILSDELKPVKVVAYEITYNGLTSVDWYADLGNGLVYFHYGSLYDHIGKDKEIKSFERSLYKREVGRLEKPVEIKDYKPNFKNMYKCNHGDWIYTGARFFSTM
jgi:hypothetical protein